MGRLISIESAGKDRTRLTKGVVLAIRELMRQPEPNPTTYDLAAFIVLALEEIYSTIDESVAAWEKRGYWVKADRFRMDWAWTGNIARSMKQALLANDWANIAMLSVQAAQKLSDVKVGERHRLGTPWEGAWDQLRK